MYRSIAAAWPCLLMLIACAAVRPALAQRGAAQPTFNTTRFDSMADFYDDNRERGRSTLVTTDSVLHATHILFDYTLRAVELQAFDGKLRELTAEMMNRMVEEHMNQARIRYIIAPPPYGYFRLAAYFGVAHKLLNPEAKLADDIAPTVEKELALIRAHQGPALSPVLGVTEDYSQYVPRGHYTRNAKFERLFLALMWYGRAGFPISGEKQPGVKLTRDEARANAWAGITLARLLDDRPLYRTPNSPTCLGLWKAVYLPTQFIVGESDDLTPPEYRELTEKIFGKDLPGGWTPDVQQKTDLFIADAAKLRPPRLLGTLQSDAEKAPPCSLRLFGQRFTPDSGIFQQLVHARVPGRYMPTGLDVMAAFGSTRALKWLQERDEPGKYEGYVTRLNEAIAEINGIDEAGWSKTAYLLWMRALKDLLAAPRPAPRSRAVLGGDQAPHYPDWFTTEAWQDKQLNAALGSWAELRHDTILYAKQTYAMTTAAMLPPPRDPVVYVEPMPQVYNDLLQLVQALQRTLTTQGVFPTELAPNYQQFTNLLYGLIVRSEMELHPGLRIKPSREAAAGMEMLPQIGAALRRIETLPEPLRAALTGNEDARMAVIADVHTDPNARRVLEVGVGRVMAVTVPVPDGDATVQASGPVFSYYEFTQPMDARLTDAAWQQMLADGKAPDPFILGRYLVKR